MKKLIMPAAVIATAITVFVACRKDKNDAPVITPPETIKAQSITPSLVYMQDAFKSVNIFPLISSEDILEQSPAFIYGAQPDGAGFMRNPDGKGYIMLNNHEINQSVSRVYLDRNLKPIKGDYIIDYTGGAKRLCSATLATTEEHGFGPMFLTAQESGVESMIIGINPLTSAAEKGRTDRTLPALGKASMENAVPLPKGAYPGKTVIFMGEDQSWETGHVSAGQLVMYVSNTVGDLKNGKLYAVKRKDNNQVEKDIVKGHSYDVEFVEIPNAVGLTGAQINTTVNDLKAIRFSRVEDIDYRKGSAQNNREVYFTATGQSPDKINPQAGYTMWGRVYKIVLESADPTKGKIEVIAEGDSNPGNDLINPDNLCVTENYVYIQEDGDSYYNAAKHDSYIWQYSIANKTYKPFLNMDHKRDDAAWVSRFYQNTERRLGCWEFGAMVDISNEIGVPNTFILNIHPHTWQKDKFVNPDGGGSTNKEGGQTVILTNVPR